MLQSRSNGIDVFSYRPALRTQARLKIEPDLSASVIRDYAVASRTTLQDIVVRYRDEGMLQESAFCADYLAGIYQRTISPAAVMVVTKSPRHGPMELKALWASVSVDIHGEPG